MGFILTFYEVIKHFPCRKGNVRNFVFDGGVTSSGNYSTQTNFREPCPESSIRRFADCHSTPSFSVSSNFLARRYQIVYVAHKNRRNYIYNCANAFKWQESIRVRNLGAGKNTNCQKINIFSKRAQDIVGIKFVDIFPGNFLFQISNTHKVRQFFRKNSMLKMGRKQRYSGNVLVEANRSNEPSVLCQSTFN